MDCVARIIAALCLRQVFCACDDVVANRLVPDEQPRFVDQEHLERAELGWIGDLVAGPVQDVEQQRFQNLRRIAPAGEVEGLETAERERVFALSKRKPYWPAVVQRCSRSFSSPMMLAKFETVRCSGSRMYMRSIAVPELALFLVVEPIALVLPFDQYPEEGKQELQVLLRRWKRKRIDGEVARFLADVQVAPAEDRGQRLEAAADIEDERLRLILLRVLQQKVGQVTICPNRSCPE